MAKVINNNNNNNNNNEAKEQSRNIKSQVYLFVFNI